MMSRFLVVVVAVAAATYGASAQKVCEVDREYRADVKVYVVDHEYQADLVVYKTDRQYEARKDDNGGIWYFTDREYQADKKIYFVDKSYRADLKVYFTDSKYRAGWRRKEKERLME